MNTENLNIIVKHIDQIQFSKKFYCKTYSICQCAYETIITVEENKKKVIEFFFENDNIESVSVISKGVFMNKYSQILKFKNKDEYQKFNAVSLTERVKKISKKVRDHLIDNSII